MSKHQMPPLFVVDGSNIATEGRSMPSLEQLNEAVLSFIEEYPDVEVTVVVDATFGHRISKKETKAFDEAVANNELVTPPAGAIGRGDAFVLSIANKANAGVLSNDSFQEFHGDYEWLFDEGRLIGGKPVPHVGWVWVTRTPVRGPKSRQAVKEAKDSDRTDSKERANRRVRPKKSASRTRAASTTDVPASDSPRDDVASSTTRDTAATTKSEGSASTGPRDHVNDVMPFLDFVERHPVGTSCTAVVDSYASHGAYARVDDVLLYIPLRLMDDPAPRSAKKVLKIGESVALVIVGYTPDRRSIDAAVPHMATGADLQATSSETSVDASAASPDDRPGATTAKKSAAKKTTAKKAATKKATAKKATAKKTAAKKATAKKSAAKKTTAKKATAKKATAKKATAKKTTAKKTAAKKTAAKKTAAKKTAAKKTAAKKTTAKKTTAKKTAAKQSAAAIPAASD